MAALLTKLVGFVPIKDGDRAKAFYEDVLGLTFIANDGFLLRFRCGASRRGKYVCLYKL